MVTTRFATRHALIHVIAVGKGVAEGFSYQVLLSWLL